MNNQADRNTEHLKSHKNLLNPLVLLTEFIRLEASSGVILFAAAVLAMVLANTPISNKYFYIVNVSYYWHLGDWNYHTSLLSTTNEALMAIFFLLVGLEIKREFYLGELNSLGKITLPAIAALGGMVVPAAIFAAFNWHDPHALRGWAIPTATDIAFALGVMALLGRRVPMSVKLFLTALAIFDDIGAIVIITVFYQAKLHWPALFAAMICLVILIMCNRVHIRKLWIYILVGIFMWVFFLQSGIHPTLAGVLLAFTIPLRENETVSPLHKLEHALHPWVAYGVLPLFSFANAGISFQGMRWSELFTPLSIGIIAGLWIGKQLGVFLATWLTIRCGLAPMLKDASWRSIYGAALLCGIGFTMSLFIGNLAFQGVDSNFAVLVRFGVFLASILSGLCGYILLRWPEKSRAKST